MGFASDTLRLVLPAVIPSWRFFKTVGPSPRVEYRLAADQDWVPAMPRPARLSAAQMLVRLFWNPHWNESLFLVSCAERVVGENSALAEREIVTRVARWSDAPGNARLEVRLVFYERAGLSVRAVVAHECPVTRVADLL